MLLEHRILQPHEDLYTGHLVSAYQAAHSTSWHPDSQLKLEPYIATGGGGLLRGSTLRRLQASGTLDTYITRQTKGNLRWSVLDWTLGLAMAAIHVTPRKHAAFEQFGRLGCGASRVSCHEYGYRSTGNATSAGDGADANVRAHELAFRNEAVHGSFDLLRWGRGKSMKKKKKKKKTVPARGNLDSHTRTLCVREWGKSAHLSECNRGAYHLDRRRARSPIAVTNGPVADRSRWAALSAALDVGVQNGVSVHDPVGSPHSAPSTVETACRPALYVYELPDGYRHENKPNGRGFGVPVTSPPGLPTAALFSAVTYGTGAAFFEAALNYRCRTLEPAQADLFFVPTFTDKRLRRWCVDATPEQPKNCSRDALFLRLAAVRNGSGMSYLQARGGTDHILLTGHQGFYFDMKPSYEVSYRDRRLRGTMLFSVEDGVRYPWPGPRTLRGIHSTPWSSMVHLASTTPRDELPWRSRHDRSVLVTGAFATRRAFGPASKQFNNLRGVLHRACLRSVDRCEYASPGPALGVAGIASLYRRGVFCLQPIGDGVSRAGIIDSVLLGCIPVLFHPGQQLQWPWHWGSWVHRATVTLDMDRVVDGTLDPVEALAAIPADRIASMQATIAEYGHCLHYPRDDNKTHSLHQMPNALDITLQGSWLHKRGIRRNFTRDDLCVVQLS